MEFQAWNSRLEVRDGRPGPDLRSGHPGLDARGGRPGLDPHDGRLGLDPGSQHPEVLSWVGDLGGNSKSLELQSFILGIQILAFFDSWASAILELQVGWMPAQGWILMHGTPEFDF